MSTVIFIDVTMNAVVLSVVYIECHVFNAMLNVVMLCVIFIVCHGLFYFVMLRVLAPYLFWQNIACSGCFISQYVHYHTLTMFKSQNLYLPKNLF